jgi:hypothetical protein
MTRLIVTVNNWGRRGWRAAAQEPLCVNGHPARRSEHVTYGGKPSVHGLVRDHRVPLGLGGPDKADNVQYQTPADAEAKDRVEWTAIEACCRGEVSLEGARALVEESR